MAAGKRCIRLVGLLVLCLVMLGGTALAAQPSPTDGNGLGPDSLFVPITELRQSLSRQQLRDLRSLQSRPTTTELRVVRINEGLLLQAGDVTLNTFSNEAISMATDRLEKRAERDYSWFGNNPTTLSNAILVVDNDDIVGTIRSGEHLFKIHPLGDGLHAIIRINEQAFPADHPAEYDELEQAADAAEAAHGDHEHAQEQDIGPTANETITVIVAYTPVAAREAGNINSLIRLAVDETNQSYANSGVSPRIRLVHSYQTNYTESGSMRRDRDRFRIKNDGYMDEVHSLRNTHSADIAMLIVGRYTSSCGIAAAILATESTAFAVADESCATGYYTFGHEIGHLQGARHNPEADPSTSPFRYGHGYYYRPGRWRTVMSYNCPGGCTRIPYWSNPNVRYGGQPMGTTSTHHNARVLNETAGTMAGFR
ncbi:MAG: zinc-dependent metalloprotease [Chloroflexales bacterium]|nr:zinc-dependent metalloprotease [Chloroflexales bacterium]